MATDQEIKVFYSDLLILQYRDKPKARDTVQAFGSLIIDGQLPVAVQNAFDPDTAVGVQLDIVGKYQGITREGYSFTGPVTLNDEDFRKLINLKIIQNNSGNSLADINALLMLYFGDTIKIYDYYDMSISYYVSAAFGSQELVEVFINKGLLPKPMAVRLGSTIYHPTLKFYSWVTYEDTVNKGFPMNTYEEYNMNWPWLDYAYAINSPIQPEEVLLTEDGFTSIIQENGDKLFA